MATNRHPIRHPHRGQLNHAQLMVLRYGPDPRWANAFHSEEHFRAAWERHRDRILAGYRRGRRPQGWWRFEAPFPYPGYAKEPVALLAAGVLTEQESAELIAFWREQFERGWQPHFFHCDGPGRIFHGSIGRRKHFAWAGIPAELVRRWTAERRRRSKTIRQIEKTAAAEQPAPAA
jgi:hypothetical protein